MMPEKAQENPAVVNQIQATVELLKDYIASEPLGQAIVRFEKNHDEKEEAAPGKASRDIWKLLCQKAAQRIMEEIHRQIGSELSKLDDTLVDRAITKILEIANQKVRKAEKDAIYFALNDFPLPPEHPLSTFKGPGCERFNLFGENELIPSSN
jgi:hypothetical protein